jgi:thiol-disulfide isomerase/thioredoxin
MDRRTMMISVGVGAGAALAGAGLAAWRLTPRGDAAALEPAVTALFQQRLPRPDGGELDFATLRGKPLLLNFWATWCPPCVREMPLLDRFARERAAAGWQVVGVAVDGPTPVREFLQRQPVGFPVGLAGFGGADLARSLGNAGGALPFTVVLAADGRVVARKMGEAHAEDLAAWAAAAGA